MGLRLLCEVTVVLNIAAFLHQWVVRRSKTLFYLGNGRGVRPLFGGHYSLVFRCFLSNCRLATFHSEVKNRRYRVFLEYKLTKLERGSQKLLTIRFCARLSSVKCSAQTCERFEGVKHSLFIFISHSLLAFGSWVNLEVLTLHFEYI